MKSARATLALSVTLLVTACQTVATAGRALDVRPSAAVVSSAAPVQPLARRESIGVIRPAAGATYAAAPFASSSKTQRNLLIAGAVILAVVAAVLLLGDDDYGSDGGGGIY